MPDDILFCRCLLIIYKKDIALFNIANWLVFNLFFCKIYCKYQNILSAENFIFLV